MLQYLLNLTGIWLLSLVVFDIFLRKESYHTYNRIYLLATMLAGIIFPLVQWQPHAMPLYAAAERPVRNVIAAKGNIVAAAETANSVSWEQWLLMLYAIGVATMAGLLTIEIVKLIRYYRAGKRTTIAGWMLVETGKGHAPFSFLHLLFVSSRDAYSEAEWQMLVEHESRHTRLMHIADLVLLQLAKILFWFHPLVYVYSKRLLLVHEYQADNVGAQRPQVYGQFLVEQAVLHTAPSITHSFNRSPIKKRILMLTSKSSAIAKSKMLLILPLAVVSIVCFSRATFAKKFDKKGNTVVYNGNKFELSEATIDTIILIDPVTGGEQVRYASHPAAPVKMNGAPLPWEADKSPYFKGDDKNLREYLLKNLKPELSQLEDGNYTLNISNVLIGENGKIVYFDYFKMRRSKSNSEMQLDIARSDTALYEDIGKPLQDDIYQKVTRLMENAPEFIPAKLAGKNVVFEMADKEMFWRQFRIKEHRLYDRDSKGNYVPL